ncbi:unnamed protein product [Clavelina lepadiformis]|uniref:EF-hand domain-containing protein n=1 Tax=Clavelina lepadiformis TaxID=159417 RepID=A0ABP0EY79_CLALP
MPRANSGESKKVNAESSASIKRKAWKNASSNRPSEKDSLLTNDNGEDLHLSSFESRKGSLSLNNSSSDRGPATSPKKNGSSRLQVPSREPEAGKRSGFYFTSPSTDEGIVTDVQEADESSAQRSPKTDESYSEKERLTSAENGWSAITSANNDSPPIRVSRGHNDQYLFLNHEASQYQEGTKPLYEESSLGENEIMKRPLLYQNAQEDISNSVGINSRESERFMAANYRGVSSSKKKQTCKQKEQAKSDATDNQERAQFDSNNSSNHQPQPNMKKSQQALRHNSSRPHAALQSEKQRKNQAKGSSKPSENINDDEPVIVYSRSPDELHSSKSRLPALFVHNDKDVTSVAENRNHPDTKQLTRHRPYLEKYFPNASSVSTVSQNQSTRPKNGTLSKDAGCSQDEPTVQNSSKSRRKKYEKQHPSIDDSVSRESRDSTIELGSPENSTRTNSTRTLSARSPLVGALSSTVVATATGSVIPKNNMSSKEKQKNLTERLMTVGPSDQQRVQRIVKDITCEMGDDRITQYKEAFAKFDKDQSGIISSKQLRALLRTLGHNPTDTELPELINQVDVDENGKIDFNEFIITVEYFDKANNENEDLINIFRVFDPNGKGSINVAELRYIWNNYLQEIAPDDSFEEMIRVIDSDGDGEINRVELLEILSTR